MTSRDADLLKRYAAVRSVDEYAYWSNDDMTRLMDLLQAADPVGFEIEMEVCVKRHGYASADEAAEHIRRVIEAGGEYLPKPSEKLN